MLLILRLSGASRADPQAPCERGGKEIGLDLIVVGAWKGGEGSLRGLLVPKEGALGFLTRLSRRGAEGRGTGGA